MRPYLILGCFLKKITVLQVKVTGEIEIQANTILCLSFFLIFVFNINYVLKVKLNVIIKIVSALIIST